MFLLKKKKKNRQAHKKLNELFTQSFHCMVYTVHYVQEGNQHQNLFPYKKINNIYVIMVNQLSNLASKIYCNCDQKLFLNYRILYLRRYCTWSNEYLTFLLLHTLRWIFSQKKIFLVYLQIKRSRKTETLT